MRGRREKKRKREKRESENEFTLYNRVKSNHFLSCKSFRDLAIKQVASYDDQQNQPQDSTSNDFQSGFVAVYRNNQFVLLCLACRHGLPAPGRCHWYVLMRGMGEGGNGGREPPTSWMPPGAHRPGAMPSPEWLVHTVVPAIWHANTGVHMFVWPGHP